MAHPASPLPGIPIVEIPGFEQLLPKLGWNKHEQRVALDLHKNSFAVLKFPDENFHERYVSLNPDLDKPGLDPFQHFLLHGIKEGQRYR